VNGTLSRGRFVRAALGALASLGLVARPARAAAEGPPLPSSISVRTLGAPFAGDRELFATVVPGPTRRGAAALRFSLARAATVRVEAIRVAVARPVVWSTRLRLPAGRHVVTWTPDPLTPVGQYLMRLTTTNGGSKRTVLGLRRPTSVERQHAPVVRVLGVEAFFERRSYVSEEPMTLTILADTPRLTARFIKLGDEKLSTGRNDELSGVPMGEPFAMEWAGKRSSPNRVTVQTGIDWPTGVYAIQLDAESGQVGWAPFILRAKEPGASRTAVVVSTHTWQAYNYYDGNGDGWGDTWYAGGNPPVRLDRPYLDRGVPPRFRRYDLPFLKWLKLTGRTPDLLTDDDLDALANGDELRRTYDLVVVPGHAEYVTEEAYDVLQRFRDLGGRLIFLSSNNLFWRVDKRDETLARVRKWRRLGRPEAALLGTQYRANDDGSSQAPYEIVGADRVPWLFEGTGLENGSTFGETVGGYGIEIDARSPASPSGTILIARVPDLFGPGLTAEMTYYESSTGARVFSAGTLDFCTSVLAAPVPRMLDNLWRHMLEGTPGEESEPEPGDKGESDAEGGSDREVEPPTG
jgi:N,N-dimethylformamidase beta subunit-like, C-terminal